MKAKVLIAFNDKYTGKEHKKGDVIDVNAKRFAEITKKGNFIQPVDEKSSGKEKEK